MDSILQAGQDLQEQWWDLFLKGKEESLKQKMLKDYLEKHLDRYLRVMQQRLLSNSSQRYLVGDKISLADFDSAHIAYSYLLNEKNAFYKEQAEAVERFPDLKKYYEGLHEEMGGYFGQRPKHSY